VREQVPPSSKIPRLTRLWNPGSRKRETYPDVGNPPGVCRWASIPMMGSCQGGFNGLAIDCTFSDADKPGSD